MEKRSGFGMTVRIGMLAAAVSASAGLLGILPPLLGGQPIDPVGLGYNAKMQSNGGQGAAPVIPKSEGCVINGNGTFTASWGYDNANGNAVSIPIGSGNKFYPGNANQGQPTTFQPGDHQDAFTTVFSGATLTWILNGRTASAQSCNCVAACPFRDSLVKETWDAFDTSKWQGDGDQQVQGGYFSAQLLAFSAFADWKNATPVTVEANAVVHLDQRFRFDQLLPMPFSQSGTVYRVNKDKDETFDDYAFVNIGYTALPANRLFVEIFGADGGVGFDNFVETPVTGEPQKTFSADLRITPNGYAVAIDGIVMNSVTLVNALTQVDLFEVGVQKNAAGLEGHIDATYIYKTCR